MGYRFMYKTRRNGENGPGWVTDKPESNHTTARAARGHTPARSQYLPRTLSSKELGKPTYSARINTPGDGEKTGSALPKVVELTRTFIQARGRTK
jgi:hypothetical protein